MELASYRPGEFCFCVVAFDMWRVKVSKGTVFFFQAEDGIRYSSVTGVQTCALPIFTVAGGVVPDSASVTFNQAGTYFWQAVYSGDSNNQGSSSLCTSETVAVGPVPTTLATTLSSSSILVGASVHDSASLSGQTAVGRAPVSTPVTPDNRSTTAASKQKTPQRAATSSAGFFFNDTATTEIYPLSLHDALPIYSGDSNNQGSSSLCTSETVAVGPVPTTLATTLSSSSILVGASVHDSASLSGQTADPKSTRLNSSHTYNTYTASASTKITGHPAPVPAT